MFYLGDDIVHPPSDWNKVFIAPVVDTPTRAGRILRFGKEQFAINDFRRAYGWYLAVVKSGELGEP